LKLVGSCEGGIENIFKDDMHLLEMEKRALGLVLIVIGLVMFSGVVTGQDEAEDAMIDKAYDCLKDKVNETASLSLEEAVFSVLALGANDKVMDKIEDSQSSSEMCWPSSGCTIKDTAQVALAYDRIGRDTSNITGWLLTKNGTASGLLWYLQIVTENNEPDTCDVSYDGAPYTYTIGEDMKLSGSGGTCLSVAGSGYRLRIANSCLNKEFITSCDLGFKTNLLYEKGTGGTIYVSSETHSAAAKGTTTEKIGAQCFMVGGSCNYEATLWAAAAVYATTSDTGDFIPYLRSLASEYRVYFPSAFLVYMMGGSDSVGHYQYIIENKNRGGYWQFGADKYFDTALAMLALSEIDIRSQGTIDYLLKGAGRQTDKGCWNSDNIRDTAFILYAGPWVLAVDDDGETDGGDNGGGDVPDNPPSDDCGDGVIDSGEVCECGDDGECGNEDDDLNNETCVSQGYDSGDLFCKDGCTNFEKGGCVGGGGGGGVTVSDCEFEGYYCVSGIFDCYDAGGDVLNRDIYTCNTMDEVCCTVDVEAELEMCSDLGGRVCGFDEECDGSSVEAADGTCCQGACIAYSTGDECGDAGGTCRTVCMDDEEDRNYDCSDSGKVCCFDSRGGDEPSGGISWFWIIILIVLIILVVVGIIFRDKLRVMWYKMRGKAKSKRVGPPGPDGGRMMPRPVPRFGFGGPGARRPVGRAPVGRPASGPRPKPSGKKDKELEETMEKLKKMSE